MPTNKKKSHPRPTSPPTCASLDNPDSNSCHPYRGYQFSYSLSPENNAIFHTCNDDPNSGYANACRNSLCECDKKLVEDLSNFQDIYSTNNHAGSFDYSSSCVSNCQRDENNKCIKYDACCENKNGVRKPFSSMGGRMQCCKDQIFDGQEKVCCGGDEVKDFC